MTDIAAETLDVVYRLPINDLHPHPSNPYISLTIADKASLAYFGA